MKTMRSLIGSMLAATGLFGATANEVYLTQRKADNTANVQRTFVPTENGLLTFDATLTPTITSTPTLSTLRLTSTDDATDATGLTGSLGTLGGLSVAKTGWFGDNVTIAKSTGRLTFGVTNTASLAVDANGKLTATPRTGQSFYVNGLVTQRVSSDGTSSAWFRNLHETGAGVYVTGGNSKSSGAYILKLADYASSEITTFYQDRIETTANLYVTNSMATITLGSGATAGSLAIDGSGDLTLASAAGRTLTINAGTVSTIGNVTASGTGIHTFGTTNTVTLSAGVLTATGNVTGANLTTGGIVSATGNVTGGNLTTGGIVQATGNITGGNVTTGGLISATGNVTGANLTTTGTVSASGTGNHTFGTTNTVTLGSGNITATGQARIQSTEDATDATGTTGSLGTLGGLSVAGKTYFGKDAYVQGMRIGRGPGADLNNLVFGVAPLEANLTGDNNLAIGSGALSMHETGSHNVAIGHGVLLFAPGSSGSYNVGVGNSALVVTSGSGSVALGYSAGKYETGSNAFYVNNQDRTNTAGDKAKSLLYGTFDATAANQTLTINAGTVSTIGNVTASGAGTHAFGGLLTATGNITGANITTGGSVIATGNITGGNIVASGSLGVTGNISAGNFTTTGLVSATGNISGGNLTSAGNITVNGAAQSVFAGTIYTQGGGTNQMAGNLTIYGNLTSNGLTTTLGTQGESQSSYAIITGGASAGVGSALLFHKGGTLRGTIGTHSAFDPYSTYDDIVIRGSASEFARFSGTGMTTPGNITASGTGGHSFGTTNIVSLYQGGVRAMDGSVSGPAYSFQNDSTSGLYRESGSILSFGVNGTRRLRLLPDGRVMGGGALNYLWLVDDGSVMLTSSGSATDTTIAAGASGNVVVGPKLAVLSDTASVTLGTTNKASLAVDGAGALTIAPTSGQYLIFNSKIQLPTHTTNAGGIGFLGGFGTHDTTLYRQSAGYLYVDSESAPLLGLSTNNTSRSWWFWNGSFATLASDSSNLVLQAGGANSLVFRTNSGTRGSIDSSGNLTMSGSGSHIFGTTNTVTLSGGNITATGTGNHTFGTTNTVTLSGGNITANGTTSTIALGSANVTTLGTNVNGSFLATSPNSIQLALSGMGEGTSFVIGQASASQLTTDGATSFSLAGSYYATLPAMMNFRTRRGTALAPTAIQSGDNTGRIDFQGWIGNQWGVGARLTGTALENFSSSPVRTATKLTFSLVPVGSDTLSNVLTLANAESSFGTSLRIPGTSHQFTLGSSGSSGMDSSSRLYLSRTSINASGVTLGQHNEVAFITNTTDNDDVVVSFLGDVLHIGTATGGAGHYVGVIGRAQDTSSGGMPLYGIEGKITRKGTADTGSAVYGIADYDGSTFAGRVLSVYTGFAEIYNGSISNPVNEGTIAVYRAFAGTGGHSALKFALLGDNGLQIYTGGPITSASSTGGRYVTMRHDHTDAHLETTNGALRLYPESNNYVVMQQGVGMVPATEGTSLGINGFRWAANVTTLDASGNITATSTGNHTFGTTNTVTLGAGNVTATGNITGGNLTTSGTVTSTSDITVPSLLTSGAHCVSLVAGGAIEVGNIVMVGSVDGQVVVNTKYSSPGTDQSHGVMPVGVYVGTGPATANQTVTIALGGIAYLSPDTASSNTVVRSALAHQGPTTDGYAEFDTGAVAAEHNAEVGHPLYAENRYTFNANTGVNTGTETITLDSAPGWAIGDPVVYWARGDTPPTGMTTSYVYWIKTISSANVTLTRTKGGSTLDLTATGSGTSNYLQRLPKTIIHFN